MHGPDLYQPASRAERAIRLWPACATLVAFTGVLDGTAMSGTWAANACSDSTISLTGTWEATKQ